MNRIGYFNKLYPQNDERVETFAIITIATSTALILDGKEKQIAIAIGLLNGLIWTSTVELTHLGYRIHAKKGAIAGAVLGGLLTGIGLGLTFSHFKTISPLLGFTWSYKMITTINKNEF